MTSGKKPLPPPPPSSRRTLSGVQAKGPYPPDPLTKPKGATLAMYQGLLSVFDEMTNEQRMEFVELAYVFGQLSGEDRKALVEIANRFKG